MVTLDVHHRGLPEHTAYHDEGCDLYRACLSCPLPACRFDLPPGRAKSLVLTNAVGQLLGTGRTVDQIADTLGVSGRQVYRLRQAQRHRDAGEGGAV